MKKAEMVIQRLEEMKLLAVAKKVKDSIDEILTYMLFYALPEQALDEDPGEQYD